jgi:protocatechuate 3,4-dioxygenase beta subunit
MLLLLGTLALLASAPAGGGVTAAGCTATPNDGAGPFGRGLPPKRSKIGTGYVLSGVVLSAADCRPLPGALVQFWQSGKNGYTRAGSATVVADRAGRFTFRGPRPGTYGPEPHVHIRVAAKDHETLLTRYEIRARRGSVTLVLVPDAV